MQPRARAARAARASCADPAVRELESSRSATGAALAARRLPPLFFDLAGFSIKKRRGTRRITSLDLT